MSNISLQISFAEDAWLEQLLKDKWREFAKTCTTAVFTHTDWQRPSEISMVFANDALIQDLNAHYRGKDSATNVLSFPLLHFARPTEPELEECMLQESVLLGDIVFAYETVLKECMDSNKTFLDHTFHLMAHGVLHLLGYDHESISDAQCMENLEVSILKEFNIVNPYINYYE